MKRAYGVIGGVVSAAFLLAALSDQGAALAQQARPQAEQGRQQAAPAKPPGQGEPGVIDANRDGGLNRNELRQAREQAFVKMDTDKDGKLVRAELEAVRDRLARVWAARPPELAAAQPPPPLDIDHFFSVNDRNRDATITKAEFLMAIDERFQLLDANKDGRITKEEVQAAARRK